MLRLLKKASIAQAQQKSLLSKADIAGDTEKLEGAMLRRCRRAFDASDSGDRQDDK